MWRTVEIRFAVDDPTAAGHFPGHPVIPGALLLEEIVRAIAGDDVAVSEIVIPAVKFLAPVRPGEVVRLRWRSRDDGQISFEGRLAEGERLAVVGTLRLGSAVP
jgi:3-hydroxymyristoyl/3-hydroxydecanoyl-(acyl carrier protein) dehydratase